MVRNYEKEGDGYSDFSSEDEEFAAQQAAEEFAEYLASDRTKQPERKEPERPASLSGAGSSNNRGNLLVSKEITDRTVARWCRFGSGRRWWRYRL